VKRWLMGTTTFQRVRGSDDRDSDNDDDDDDNDTPTAVAADSSGA